jgi:hypothetical protein
METATAFVNAVITAYPTVTELNVPKTDADKLELDGLPTSISVYTWERDYCQVNDEANEVVVIFRI